MANEYIKKSKENKEELLLGDKRLSEVVDYNLHIAPYKLIQIIAGVGAGKNYWAENCLMKDRSVLLITSRKAKLEETEHKSEDISKLDMSALKAEEGMKNCLVKKR